MAKKLTAAQWAALGESSKSKSKSGKIGVKGWLVISAAGFVGASAIGQSGKEPAASAATATGSYGSTPSCYRQQWSTDVLNGIGAQVKADTQEIMVAWSMIEAGHFGNAAKNNPLNTNRPTKDSYVAIGLDSIRAYKSPEAGVEATVESLKLPAFAPIVKKFKQGNDPQGTIAAIKNAPWAMSHYQGISWGVWRERARQELAAPCGSAS